MTRHYVRAFFYDLPGYLIWGPVMLGFWLCRPVILWLEQRGYIKIRRTGA